MAKKRTLENEILETEKKKPKLETDGNESSRRWMVTDAQLKDKMRSLILTLDLTVVTPKMIRRMLEKHFNVKLSQRKRFIKEACRQLIQEPFFYEHIMAVNSIASVDNINTYNIQSINSYSNAYAIAPTTMDMTDNCNIKYNNNNNMINNYKKEYQGFDLQILCLGYVRIFFFNEKINYNATDIASLLYKYLFIDWKWDFSSHLYLINGPKCILNNGKTFVCNNATCNCFARCNVAMSPNCGIYTIKLQINESFHCFENKSQSLNCIGITTNNDIYNNSYDKPYRQWQFSNDYIAWGLQGINATNDTKWGLIFGNGPKESKNIFYKNNIKYESNNEYNKNGLPCIDDNDIIIMCYDSNRNELSFIKENDSKCSCKITNLPKNRTCYWFIGHNCGIMQVNIMFHF